MAIPIREYTEQVRTPNGVVAGPGRISTADVSAPYEALAQAGGAIANVALREQARRDEMDLMRYERQLGDIDTKLMFGDGDQEVGALRTQGVQAQDITKNTIGEFDRQANGLMPQFRTERARQQAENMLAVRKQDAEKRLTAHEFDQRRVADDQMTTAALSGYHTEAITNAESPEMVDAAIARASGARAAYGRRLGEHPDFTAEAIRKQESNTIKDVLSTQLTRSPELALETFKRNAERLTGDDRIQVERAMQPYVLDVQSKAIGDSLYAGGQPQVAVGSASLYDAIALTESGGRQFNDAGQVIEGPTTSSGAKAVGKFQIMPATGPEAARLAGEEWSEERLRNDAAYNDRLGRAYLDAQVKRFKGNIPVVAAAYNMGPVAAEKWAAGVPYQTASGKTWTPKAPMDLSAMPTETRNYIAKVTERMGGMPGSEIHSGTGLDAIATREVDAIRRADQISDPRLRDQAINRVQFLAANDRKLEQERLRQHELAKTEFVNNYQNVVAKLGAGVDVPVQERPTEEQLQVAYGPSEGSRKFQEMQTVSRIAPAVAQLNTATLAEAGPIISKFSPDPKSDNFAFEKKLHDGMLEHWKAIQTARNLDPAAFLLQNSKAVAGKYASVTDAQNAVLEAKTAEDRATAAQNLMARGQAYTSFMMAEQDRLGVPAQSRKLLPIESVKRITGQFDSMVAQGDIAGAANMIRTTVGSFGDGAAVAIDQLGKTAGPALRFTLEGVDPRTVETFIAANGQKEEDLKKSIGNDAWRDMSEEVRKQLAPLDSTGTSEYPVYMDAATKVAAMKVKAGMTPKQASQQAAAELINSRYMFAGRESGVVNYRVPLSTPQGNPIDAPSVIRGAGYTLDTLKPESITIGEATPAGVTADLYKKYRVERIKNTGQWRTLGDESGLELTYQDDSGRLVPVRGPDGAVIRKTWQELTTAMPARSQLGGATGSVMRGGGIL